MDKREKIIKAAMLLFVKQGFENTPTSQISKASSVATGTLFHHFKTKEDLINEIYRYVKKSMASAIFKRIDSSINSEEKIKRVWMDLIKWGFVNKVESSFLQKFYGSSYINKLTVEEMAADFEIGVEIFEKAKKEKTIKNLSINLFEGITFSLFYNFLSDFQSKKALDKKSLDLSYQIYWDAIKR